jgi:hypothetical protein
MGSSVDLGSLVASASSAWFVCAGEWRGAVCASFNAVQETTLEQNASYHPVLKHGPRSLTCVRVLGVFEPPARN